MATEGRWQYFRREMYVGIQDPDQDITFLGRLIEGPFYAARKGHTAKAKAASSADEQQERSVSYYLHGTVEVLGQLVESERLVQTTSRPRPGSSPGRSSGEKCRYRFSQPSETRQFILQVTLQFFRLRYPQGFIPAGKHPDIQAILC